MKTILKYLIIPLVLFPTCISAQFSVESSLNTTEIKDMKTAVQYYWDWNTNEDPVKAIFLLDGITSKNQENWLAPYWASYISTQIANSTENKKENLDKAQFYFDKAKQRRNNSLLEDKNLVSYFNALQSLIYRLKGFYSTSINDKEEATNYLSKAKVELNKGVKNKSDNPVLMVMAATDLASSGNQNLGYIIAAISLLEKAKLSFSKITNRSSIDITYWNEHWIDPWLKNLSPPNN